MTVFRWALLLSALAFVFWLALYAWDSFKPRPQEETRLQAAIQNNRLVHGTLLFGVGAFLACIAINVSILIVLKRINL